MKSKCERLSVYAQNIMSHDQSLVLKINLFLQFLTPISKATYFKQQLSRPVNSGIVDGEQYEYLYALSGSENCDENCCYIQAKELHFQ